MTEAAQRILDTFERLPEDDKRSVLAEILRRAAADDYPPLKDTDLTFAAEQVFLELDRDEGPERPGSLR
jgi:hypothetical protein